MPSIGTVELERIADRFGLADVYVFGSRADEVAAALSGRTPIAQSPSDVDIAVRPRPDRALTPVERAKLVSALEAAFGGETVDLLVLPEADAFLSLAAIRGNLLFAADADDQAEYELYVLRRAGDQAPLERERQEIVMNGGR